MVIFVPSCRFPIPHFGKLFGLMMFFGCLVQFVQVPLLQWAERSSFQSVSDEHILQYNDLSAMINDKSEV